MLRAPHPLTWAPAAVPLAALLLASCASTSKGGPSDTGVPGEGPVIIDVQVELSEIVPTVATVRWTTEEPSTGGVSFWELGGSPMTSAESTTEATQHMAVLVGLPEQVDAQLEVHASDAEGTVTSAVVDFRTGGLSSAIPRPSLEGRPEDGLGGFTLAPVAAVPLRWMTVLDPAGRLVWAWGGDELDTQRGRLTHDGQGMIVMDREMGQEAMELVRLDWDGTERWRLQVPAGHHDFDLVDDDTFVVLRSDVREAVRGDQLVTLVGDALVEISLDGSERELWNAWDHLVPLMTDYVEESTAYEGALDWTHANFVRYDRDRGQVDFTLRNLGATGSVHLESGELSWFLRGGKGSNVPLFNPHSVWPVDDGLLVFNQGDFFGGGCSIAQQLRVDFEAGQAQQTGSYDGGGCFSVYYLGNAQPLDEGRMLVAWGSSAVMDEVDMLSGERLWRLVYPQQTWLLYAERVARLGHPTR